MPNQSDGSCHVLAGRMAKHIHMAHVLQRRAAPHLWIRRAVQSLLVCIPGIMQVLDHEVAVPERAPCAVVLRDRQTAVCVSNPRCTLTPLHTLNAHSFKALDCLRVVLLVHLHEPNAVARRQQVGAHQGSTYTYPSKAVTDDGLCCRAASYANDAPSKSPSSSARVAVQ